MCGALLPRLPRRGGHVVVVVAAAVGKGRVGRADALPRRRARPRRPERADGAARRTGRHHTVRLGRRRWRRRGPQAELRTLAPELGSAHLVRVRVRVRVRVGVRVRVRVRVRLGLVGFGLANPNPNRGAHRVEKRLQRTDRLLLGQGGAAALQRQSEEDALGCHELLGG